MSPVLMPAQLGPAVAAVTVIGADWNFVESAVDVAVMMTEFAPVLAGVNVTAVPELTPDALPRVPAAAGLMERFTVLVKAPVPVTVGVQDAVWVSAIVDGLQARETAVMVGAAGAVMVIFAVPSFVESSVEVALTLSEPDVGTVDGAV
ncbi:MAG: hypothetical protein WB561_20725 [Terracidiphilus sp.]